MYIYIQPESMNDIYIYNDLNVHMPFDLWKHLSQIVLVKKHAGF
jgi:hypothetical protein